MCPNVIRKIAAATYTIALPLLLAVPVNGQNGRPAPANGTTHACAAIAKGNYALGPHIGAVFAVFVGSALGITLPVFTKGHGGKTLTEAFFLAKFFGTGVIISTAFVHLLYEAFIELASPCVRLAYKPTAPAVAMAASLVVMIVDLFVQRALRGPGSALYRGQKFSHVHACGAAISVASDDTVVHQEQDAETQAKALYEAEQRQKYLDLLVVEGGIVFHSVMVGLGLGVADDTGFIGYLVAIVFHQFCDGLAIGTRLSEVDFSTARYKQFALIAAYSFITPIGIAIGIAVRRGYNGNDGSTILAIGILDSISAGVLLYGALVDLVAKDILFGPLVYASNTRILVALLSLFVGAGIMSLIGQWA